MRSLLIFIFILIVPYSLANEQDTFRKDINLIKQEAIKGDAAQQAELGIRYRDGQGVDKDINEAIMWFEKSAAQGNIVAIMSLGIIYQGGRLGVPKDSIRAIGYYKPIAEMTRDLYPFRTMARQSLAMSYEDVGDIKNALFWYKKAAEDDGRIGKSAQESIDRLSK